MIAVVVVNAGRIVQTQEFFTPVVFDFLWEDARVGELPYPLRIRSHGAYENERHQLRRQVQTELATRNIALEAVQQQLELLAKPAISIDALHIPEYREAPVGALAASDGAQAVLATQNSEGIWLRSVYPDGLASAVSELLPACRRGSEASLTLPLDDARQIRPATADTGVSGDAKPTRRAGRSEQVANPAQTYAQIIAQPRIRGGQLAANGRDDLGGRQRSAVLAWFDTKSGRYLSLSATGADGREWVTVAPADPKTLRFRLGEMIADVTG